MQKMRSVIRIYIFFLLFIFIISMIYRVLFFGVDIEFKGQRGYNIKVLRVVWEGEGEGVEVCRFGVVVICIFFCGYVFYVLL